MNTCKEAIARDTLLLASFHSPTLITECQLFTLFISCPITLTLDAENNFVNIWKWNQNVHWKWKSPNLPLCLKSILKNTRNGTFPYAVSGCACWSINLPLEPISVDELESLTCFTEIKKNGRKKLTNIMVDANTNKEWKSYFSLRKITNEV